MLVTEILSISQLVKSGHPGHSRSSINKAISRGDLIARKLGRRVVILRDDYLRWINSAPVIGQTSMTVSPLGTAAGSNACSETPQARNS